MCNELHKDFCICENLVAECIFPIETVSCVTKDKRNTLLVHHAKYFSSRSFLCLALLPELLTFPFHHFSHIKSCNSFNHFNFITSYRVVVVKRPPPPFGIFAESWEIQTSLHKTEQKEERVLAEWWGACWLSVSYQWLNPDGLLTHLLFILFPSAVLPPLCSPFCLLFLLLNFFSYSLHFFTLTPPFILSDNVTSTI